MISLSSSKQDTTVVLEHFLGQMLGWVTSDWWDQKNENIPQGGFEWEFGRLSKRQRVIYLTERIDNYKGKYFHVMVSIWQRLVQFWIVKANDIRWTNYSETREKSFVGFPVKANSNLGILLTVCTEASRSSLRGSISRVFLVERASHWWLDEHVDSWVPYFFARA
jgi:hypothetical protein